MKQREGVLLFVHIWHDLLCTVECGHICGPDIIFGLIRQAAAINRLICIHTGLVQGAEPDTD